MYAKIKELADQAIELQNKNRMDAVLREISGMCGAAMDDNSYTGPGPATTGLTASVDLPLGATRITSIGGVPVDPPASGPTVAQAAHLIDVALAAQKRVNKKGAK